jgi:hypothetical protein
LEALMAAAKERQSDNEWGPRSAQQMDYKSEVTKKQSEILMASVLEKLWDLTAL